MQKYDLKANLAELAKLCREMGLGNEIPLLRRSVEERYHTMLSVAKHNPNFRNESMMFVTKPYIRDEVERLKRVEPLGDLFNSSGY